MNEIDTSSHILPAGTELNGKYEIIHLIGEGGFGITYFGHNKVLDIPVAIKEYYPKGYASRTVSKNLTVAITDNTKNAYFDKWKMKFLTEARMLAKFANLPGIVNVYDFFEQNGTAYIVMEYLDGITLKSYVEKNGPMDTASFFKSLIPVLKSLEKIHNQGLIHRDISPDNLMLMDDGFLKLYDFGAAREYSDVTQTNFSVIIKPCFAPEEQYRSKGVQGPWTDVYSICATIYFSITGVVPDDSLQRAFCDELKRPSELGVDISPKIEGVLLKGMSVRSADRFDSVKPLVSAFEEEDSKSIKKIVFGKEKKPKGKKTPNIFSIFRTLSQQTVSSTASHPVSVSINDKTEIVPNTEYEPNVDHLYNPSYNEVKRRLKHDLANDTPSSSVVNSNAIHNEQVAPSKNISTSTANKGQVAQSIQKMSANSTEQEKITNAAISSVSGSSITANNKAENNASFNYQRNGENKTGIVCPKCNVVCPNTAKFCRFCGISLLSFKNPVNSNSPVSPDKPHTKNPLDIKSKDAMTSSTIICPKCKAVLPGSAKFCGMCGVKLSSITTNFCT